MGSNGSTAEVHASVRKDIVTGRLSPGQKLPTHVELAEQFDVSNVTIQNALNQLAAEGFIEIRPRVGSFVADPPPHLQNIGLVFPFDPETGGEHYNWSKQYQSQANAARHVQQDLDRRIMAFHRVDRHTDSEDCRRLLRYIDQHQLAGLIFAGPPYMVKDTPICQAPHLPRVELSSAHEAPWPVIRHGRNPWYETALDYFAEHGRRRLAVLVNRFTQNEFFDEACLDRLVDERDIHCPPHWRQAAEWHDTEAAGRVVQLLMRGAEGKRPNALLITDDNLIEGVTSGLIACGVRVPQDVEVVSMANFPLSSRPSLSIKMLGYNWQNILHQAVELVDGQRKGEVKTEVVESHAVWYQNQQPSRMSPSDTSASRRQVASMMVQRQ